MDVKQILFIVIGLVLYAVFRKYLQFKKEQRLDAEELKNQNIYDKFKFLIDGFNGYCFNGKGKVSVFDNKNANVYQEGSNQIVLFQYNAGMLTIVWKYKYFQNEMVYEKNFPDARNATEIGVKGALNTIIDEFNEQLSAHKANIDKKSPHF